MLYRPDLLFHQQYPTQMCGKVTTRTEPADMVPTVTRTGTRTVRGWCLCQHQAERGLDWRHGGEGSERALALPALRTLLAVFPHTALQSVVASSGLARLPIGFMKGEKPLRREGPILLIVQADGSSPSTM